MNNFNFSLLSVNVRGINDDRKRRKLFTWLHKQSANVIYLQETYSSPQVERQWATEWGGQIVFAHGSNHSRGVAILFKSKFDYEIEESKAGNEGRYLFIKVKIQESDFTLLNVYAPNTANCQVN